MVECDQLKQVPSVILYYRCLKKCEIPTVSEFEKIRQGSYILQDDSNGEVRFTIQDLEKFQIFPLKFPFYLFFSSENLNFLGFYISSNKKFLLKKKKQKPG